MYYLLHICVLDEVTCQHFYLIVLHKSSQMNVGFSLDVQNDRLGDEIRGQLSDKLNIERFCGHQS